MNESLIDIAKYKENVKTSYLADSLVALLDQEKELHHLLESDPSMKEMAEDDLINVVTQKQALITQMDDILAVEEKEEEFPNEIVLEVRAGVGGEAVSYTHLTLPTNREV